MYGANTGDISNERVDDIANVRIRFAGGRRTGAKVRDCPEVRIGAGQSMSYPPPPVAHTVRDGLGNPSSNPDTFPEIVRHSETLLYQYHNG